MFWCFGQTSPESSEKICEECKGTIDRKWGNSHNPQKLHGRLRKLEKKKDYLFVKEEVEFNTWDYPGYVNNKGSGPNSNRTFPVGSCTTFKFVKTLSKKERKKKGWPCPCLCLLNLHNFQV